MELFRYKVEDGPFEEGGMGTLFKAIDRLSGEDVVIKTINAEKLEINEQAVNNFFKEAEASFRLSQLSNNIVKTIDIGYEAGIYFMALEYISGGNIKPFLGQSDSEKAQDIISDILKALSFAHKNGIVHSDISPDNVLYDKTNNVFKVSDFGLLKIMNSYCIKNSKTLLVGGKIDYLAPEDLYNPEGIDEKSDLYALGILYHQLLTGVLLRPKPPESVRVPDKIRCKADGFDVDEGVRIFIECCLRGGYENAEEALKEFGIQMRSLRRRKLKT
jgi:serine/threonine-protein kinase